MNVSPVLTSWFKPRTTNPNLIFRERTLRALIASIFIITLVVMLISVFIYKSEFALVSYPSIEVVALIILIVAALLVSQERIAAAGYVLVGMFVFFSVTVLLVPGSQNDVLSTSIATITLLVVALVLPRTAIFIFAIATSVLLSAVYIAENSIVRPAFTSSFSVIVVQALAAVLLFLLRLEFDTRLLSTEAARRETEQALSVAQSSRDEAERANKAKDQFLSIMSHELRTPLGAIIGFVGILQAGMIKDRKEALPLSKTQQDMLKSVRSNAEHLLTLINSILDLAKVSSGRVQSTLTNIDPTDENFITGTVNALRSLAIAKNVDLELEYDANLPSSVQCDTLQVKQIVKNLVANAIKFTDKGNIHIRVGRAPNDSWEMIVRDTGIGISPNHLKNIFDPFYQADTSDTRAREGTGLGLAIAKNYVELQNGSIQVQSTPGLGTTFTVRLPIGSPVVAAQPVVAVVAEAHHA